MTMRKARYMKIAVYFPLVVALLAVTSRAPADEAASEDSKTTLQVQVGDRAPEVKGIDHEGEEWKLSEALGEKAVLLYFYPKDDTPGCTKQACGLRDRMDQLESKNVEVVGVSMDSVESHQAFIEKYDLNFRLLADPKGEIVDRFGVRMKDRPMARRVSVLINQEGEVVHVTDHPSAATHLAEMEEAVNLKLQG